MKPGSCPGSVSDLNLPEIIVDKGASHCFSGVMWVLGTAMRVTSEFFVSALVRRIFGEGGFAAVSKKGAPEAGAVFICVDRLDGTFDFYGPAPQSMFSELPQGRLFEQLFEGTDKDAIERRLASEARMDPDYWLVDIEAREGQVDLPLAQEEAPDPGAGVFRF